MEFQIGRGSKAISKRLNLPGCARAGVPVHASRYRHLYTADGDAASERSTCYRESRQAAALAGASKEDSSGRGKLRRRYVTWTIGPNALDAEPIKRGGLSSSMTSRGNDRGCRVVSRIRETILSLSWPSPGGFARYRPDRDPMTRCVVLRRKFQRPAMTRLVDASMKFSARRRVGRL